jgi:uncharacterized protein (TIGR03083 family)
MTSPTARAAHIDAESARFASVLGTVEPSTPVPTCPAWTAHDLLAHLTEVHSFWAAVIGERLTAAQVGEFEERRDSPPTDRDDLLDTRRRATASMLAALEARAPEEAAWSWFEPDQTVDFTWRMQTHEATMHRVDAELTAGVALSPIPAAIAADGVDHVVNVMWAWAPASAARRVTGRVDLRATDTGRVWRLATIRWSGEAWGQTFTDQASCVPADDDSGVAQAVVSGTAEALDLLVWTRRDEGIERSGDEQVLAEFQATLDGGIA